MSIADDIITKANPPNDNIVVVLQLRMTLDREELETLKSDYDFWVMITDFNPDVEVKTAYMEVPKVDKT